MSANPDPANRQPIIAATSRLTGQQDCDGLSQIRVLRAYQDKPGV